MQAWLLQTLSDVLNRHHNTEDEEIGVEIKSKTAIKLERNYGERKHLAELKAQREWFAAIAALEKLLLSNINLIESTQQDYQGLIFSAPAPILSNLELANRFPTGIFTPDAFNAKALMPSSQSSFADLSPQNIISPIVQLPLLPKDPISVEQFCLIFTTDFALVMVLGEDKDGVPAFHFSFEPEAIEQVWATLRSRLLVTNYSQLSQLDELIRQFAPPIPDYRLVSQFSRQLLKHLPDLTALAVRKARQPETIAIYHPPSRELTKSKQALSSHSRLSATRVAAWHEKTVNNLIGNGLPDSVVADRSYAHGFSGRIENSDSTNPSHLDGDSHNHSSSSAKNKSVSSSFNSPTSPLHNPHVGSQLEMELLQALTHEIRTPLTTIRTLTKLILKRKDSFTPKVVKHLQAIDQECTEQIDRMELIFRAAELESTPPAAKYVQLTKFPLEQIFQQTIPRWQKQAQKRHVELDVILPQQLPKVISDPAMLDQMLTGLIENYTRSLPHGGQICVKVSTAGNQLKLQLTSKCSVSHNPLKSLGQLLMFQPETGCLSLSREVTKNIFQILGGKLTFRQRPDQEEELTIFLPLGNPTNPL